MSTTSTCGRTTVQSHSLTVDAETLGFFVPSETSVPVALITTVTRVTLCTCSLISLIVSLCIRTHQRTDTNSLLIFLIERRSFNKSRFKEDIRKGAFSSRTHVGHDHSTLTIYNTILYIFCIIPPKPQHFRILEFRIYLLGFHHGHIVSSYFPFHPGTHRDPPGASTKHQHLVVIF